MGKDDNIIKDIKNKKLHPIYFLQGEEPFFIDRISKTIEDEVLSEDEKGFDQHVIYANDTEIENIIALAKQFPMAAPFQVIIVKEAQYLSRSIDKLHSYAENPQLKTVLVFNYKGKKLDGRLSLSKLLKKNDWLYESPKVYDSNIPNYIDNFAHDIGIQIDTKSKFMMIEFLGADLGRIYNELQKLKIVAPNGMVTPEIVEKNIGVSKDYNNFELQSAIGSKDAVKAIKIARYFGEDPKRNPLVLTITVLYNMFSKLIVYHTLKDKSTANLARELGINPFFVKEYQIAGQNYPLKKVTRIISMLRETDIKSKGVETTGNVSYSELLEELILKIMSF